MHISVSTYLSLDCCFWGKGRELGLGQGAAGGFAFWEVGGFGFVLHSEFWGFVRISSVFLRTASDVYIFMTVQSWHVCVQFASFNMRRPKGRGPQAHAS